MKCSLKQRTNIFFLSNECFVKAREKGEWQVHLQIGFILLWGKNGRNDKSLNFLFLSFPVIRVRKGEGGGLGWVGGRGGGWKDSNGVLSFSLCKDISLYSQ